MATEGVTHRVFFVLLTATVILHSPDCARADYSEWQAVERLTDWTAEFVGRRIGITEERDVRFWYFNDDDGRQVLAVKTAIHYGFGVIFIPCRLPVFVALLAVGMTADISFSAIRLRNSKQPPNAI